MRAVILCAIPALVAGGLGACHRLPQPASEFNVAEPPLAIQLISGFYSVEQRGSRWAAGQFAVALKPPSGAAVRGGRLWVKLFIPDYQIDAIGPMTLTASIDGCELASQTFSQGGFHFYSSSVPKDLLDTNIVPVHFSFDNYILGGEGERELGAVITDIGLKAN